MTREEMAHGLRGVRVYPIGPQAQFDAAETVLDAAAEELSKMCATCKLTGPPQNPTATAAGRRMCMVYGVHQPPTGFCHRWEPKP